MERVQLHGPYLSAEHNPRNPKVRQLEAWAARLEKGLAQPEAASQVVTYSVPGRHTVTMVRNGPGSSPRTPSRVLLHSASEPFRNDCVFSDPCGTWIYEDDG